MIPSAAEKYNYFWQKIYNKSYTAFVSKIYLGAKSYTSGDIYILIIMKKSVRKWALTIYKRSHFFRSQKIFTYDAEVIVLEI